MERKKYKKERKRKKFPQKGTLFSAPKSQEAPRIFLATPGADQIIAGRRLARGDARPLSPPALKEYPRYLPRLLDEWRGLIAARAPQK